MNLHSITATAGQWEERFRFLGIKLINVNDFGELIVRLTLNTFVVFCIVHFLYAKYSNKKDFYFSYIAIGLVVFVMCFLLNSVKLELGFALGLFALFGIVRYRTDAIPIKEMTYLFVIIGISVINALANKKVSYTELIFTNTTIVFGLWMLEKRLMLKQETVVHLVYEKIDDLKLLSNDELLKELRKRTGININRFEIQKIDYLKDVIDFTLYYYTNGTEDSK